MYIFNILLTLSRECEIPITDTSQLAFEKELWGNYFGSKSASYIIFVAKIVHVILCYTRLCYKENTSKWVGIPKSSEFHNKT